MYLYEVPKLARKLLDGASRQVKDAERQRDPARAKAGYLQAAQLAEAAASDLRGLVAQLYDDE